MNTHIEKLLSHSNFYIGGSRYMAQKAPSVIFVNENTDYDFYCADSPENHRILTVLGFDRTNMVPAYPYDDLAVDIYVHAGCQVIVRSDVDLYQKVISKIDPVFYRDYLWKSGPNRPGRDYIQAIFNQLFKMAK